MSWGVQVQGTFGRLPIDEDYHNLVRESQGSLLVQEGYHDYAFFNQGFHSRTFAVRHPGVGISLLGFIVDDHGVRGIRVYVEGSGRLYWRSYIDAYPLPENGWGMMVYNAKGEQTFHSDHNYADVVAEIGLAYDGYPTRGGYYFLMHPAALGLSYVRSEWIDSYSFSRNECQYVTVLRSRRRCYTSNYTYCSYHTYYDSFSGSYVSEYVCETRTRETCRTEYYYDSEWQCKTVFYLTEVRTVLIYVNKELGFIIHSGADQFVPTTRLKQYLVGAYRSSQTSSSDIMWEDSGTAVPTGYYPSFSFNGTYGGQGTDVLVVR